MKIVGCHQENHLGELKGYKALEEHSVKLKRDQF